MDYKAIDLTDNADELEQEMRERSGRTSVPQIFINGQHIGGFDDIAALDGDLSPEERSADNAAREAQSTTGYARDRLAEIGRRPLDKIYQRIEQAEGKEHRALAEAGRKLAEAGPLYTSGNVTA